MASSYTGLGTELMTTGENAGTWGTTTNTNLQIIEQISGGYTAQSIAGGAQTTTLSVSDGSTGATLAHRVIEFTGTITGNQVVTIPLDVQTFYIMKNNTSGAYTVQFKYVSGSGSSVTWAATDKGTKLIYATADDGTNPNMVDSGIGSTAAHDLDGNELILDADADTSITADTDDQIDIKIAGADDFTFTANAFNVLTGSNATFADSANAKFGTGNDMLLYHDGSNSYITNAQGALKIATETSGIALTIGHTTSETTVADNLSVTGNVTVGVDDTGGDVKFFGASAGAYALWDESENLLDLRGATAAGPGYLKLTTGELTVVDADKLGRIDFQAPLESDGTDAVAIAASIWAEADDTFSSSVNNTDLVFALGKSEAAAEKFRFTADNEIGIAGANYGTDGQVLTSGGAGAAVAWEDASTGAVTAINNATANEIVTVGSTTTELDAEGNFTYDGNNAALTSSVSTNPIVSITNTNTDANGSIIKFIKDAGEAGAANDVSGLISFYADDADQNNQEFGRITGRVVDATAGGEEGALDFYVAEYDGTVTKGMEIKGLSSDGNITVDVSTHDGSAGGLMLGGTLVTSTATELNIMDGGTSATSTTLVNADRLVVNDNGTMVQVAISDVKTYLNSAGYVTDDPTALAIALG
jgi:hypothetical protein